MRSDKFLAAVLSAVIPFSANAFMIENTSAVYAEDSVKLPDWIPENFDEALKFRNTYGATHIGKNVVDRDTVCVVFMENSDNEEEYRLKVTETKMTEIYHEVFTDENANFRYEVVAYTNFRDDSGRDSFDVALFSGEDLLLAYNFLSYQDNEIIEDDLFSWLPDCVTEYEDHVKANGEVSTYGEYVLFCFDSNAGTPYEWIEAKENNDEAVYYTFESCCTEETAIPLDGGKEHNIVIRSFKDNGHFKLSYNYVPMINKPLSSEDIVKTLTADCMVIDGCSTVLLSDDLRVQLLDKDTEEKVPVRLLKDKNFKFRQCSKTDAMYPINFMDTNTMIFKKLHIYNADDFDGYWNDRDAAEEVTVYENGAVDVRFRLDLKEDGLAPNQTRITLYDSDTGELIPNDIIALHPFTFGTDVRVKMSEKPDDYAYTGPVYIVNENPQVYSTDLASLYRSADKFLFRCEEDPEVTLHDNGAMDLVFKIKVKVTGDINNDGGFTLADLVMMNKWLLNGKGDEFAAWGNGDFCIDGKLDVFDLCIMRKKLVEKMAGTNYYFEAQYIRSNGIGDIEYPQTEIITDLSELESYISSKKDNFDIRDVEVAAEKYNAEWFDEHKLLVVLLEEGSGSIKHKVTGITNNSVAIERLLPEVGTCDMAEWFILIETDKDFDICNDFEVKTINIDAR